MDIGDLVYLKMKNVIGDEYDVRFMMKEKAVRITKPTILIGPVEIRYDWLGLGDAKEKKGEGSVDLDVFVRNIGDYQKVMKTIVDVFTGRDIFVFPKPGIEIDEWDEYSLFIRKVNGVYDIGTNVTFGDGVNGVVMYVDDVNSYVFIGGGQYSFMIYKTVRQDVTSVRGMYKFSIVMRCMVIRYDGANW